jgi:hypothetical protein
MTALAVGSVLWLTSVVSLAVYFISLVRLLEQQHNAGLVRTVACRVFAAFLYIVISMSTIAGHKSSPIITVSTFIVIQVMWQVNSIADVYLARRQNRRQPDGHTTVHVAAGRRRQRHLWRW